MSDETYYTVLNVKETASPSEIKTAYRDLIKQVHPDTVTNLAPYLRRIAEDKAKEVTEAYTVLSNSSKRREYDNQLAGYRRQAVPQTPPAATPSPGRQASSQTSSGPYCNRCGTSLYVSGFCPKCNKFTGPTATPPQPKVVRWLGYNWAPVMRWSREHPFIVVFAVLFSGVFIASLFPDANTAQSPANTSRSPESKSSFTNNAAAASKGAYSKYPCDFRDKISPIDGKLCSERQDQSVPAPPPGFTVDEKTTGTQSPTPTIWVSGAYVGTVHNQTANLSSTFTVVIHQMKDGVLGGCMRVQPPLYGSGVLRGSIRRSHVNFVVADITFQGDASKSGIAGSYVVTRQEGNQLGEFHLMKQASAEPSYHCEDGVLTAASQTFSDVPPGYKVLPPAANLTVETPNAPATGPKPPAEARAGPKQPDLSGLTSSERQSIEAACSHAKYIEGPAAYDRCLVRQLDAWRVGPREPDLSSLTSSERQSIEAACSHAKYIEGPAAYDRCLIRQFDTWAIGPKEPDLSRLTSSERQSIQAACSHAKYIEGPLAYDRCLVRQLEALANYRQ